MRHRLFTGFRAKKNLIIHTNASFKSESKIVNQDEIVYATHSIKNEESLWLEIKGLHDKQGFISHDENKNYLEQWKGIALKRPLDIFENVNSKKKIIVPVTEKNTICIVNKSFSKEYMQILNLKTFQIFYAKKSHIEIAEREPFFHFLKYYKGPYQRLWRFHVSFYWLVGWAISWYVSMFCLANNGIPMSKLILTLISVPAGLFVGILLYVLINLIKMALNEFYYK